MTQLVNRTVHVRIDGRSDEFALTTLGLQENATDAQMKVALARHLDLPATALVRHVIVRTSQAIIVRPEAIYG